MKMMFLIFRKNALIQVLKRIGPRSNRITKTPHNKGDDNLKCRICGEEVVETDGLYLIGGDLCFEHYWQENKDSPNYPHPLKVAGTP
jgi:hypothetical protein